MDKEISGQKVPAEKSGMYRNRHLVATHQAKAWQNPFHLGG